ncbi:pseudouridine synthase [Aquimarina agarivorans]|uniref:pseudouridine synthase n=1 Tax=Aquimarina agarivorans TaxID=980584 RepID=UPI000248E6EC|nr:pseudouridine synthase [Aquimarina agarivorans]
MSQAQNNRNKKSTGLRKGKSVQKKNMEKPQQARPIKSKKQAAQSPDTMRLNKYIGNSGICTRKDADLYISTGSVKVNGVVVTEMGYKVKLTDEVRFDGQLIRPVKNAYILINKPKGYTIAANTSNEKKSVYALLQAASKSFLKPVGKMERNSSGLLLLSNDDSFLGNMNGSGRIRQIYHVELDKNLVQQDFEKILEGVRIDDHIVKVQELSFVSDASKREIGIQLNSQKNRIVTRIFEALGYKVNHLDRVVFGGLTKKDLPRGRWRELSKQEVINMRMLA